MNTDVESAWTPASLGAFRALEAAARHGSFTAAAGELRVTQSAVSHAVRDIESRLGVMLFLREGRRVALTEQGKSYVALVRAALRQLRAADEAVLDPGRRARVLTVSVSPSFAAKWLAPRIGSFVSRHPDLDLRVSASAQHVDFSDPDIDLAIRHGDGDWPDLEAVELCSERWLPVAAPSIASLRPRPGDFSQHVLIHHRDMSGWRRWFERNGISVSPRSMRGLTLSEMSLAIDAAAARQGIALARSALAARDLLAGRLKVLSGDLSPAEIGYWIVRPKARPRLRKIACFTAWLRAEAAAETTALDRLLAGEGGHRAHERGLTTGRERNRKLAPGGDPR